MGRGKTKVMNFQDKGTQIQMYVDEPTGICLAVENDIPDHPKLTVHGPERCMLSTDEINEAIYRLLAKAGMKPPGQPAAPPPGGKP